MLKRSRTDEDHARAFAAAVKRVFPRPTPRQDDLIREMFETYFEAPELRVCDHDELDVEVIGAAYDSEDDRRVLIQMLVLIEMCRGTGGGEAQALALERLARELEVDEAYLLVGRDAALGAVDLLTEDWRKLYEQETPEASNRGLRDGDPDALARLRSIDGCAPGSVGAELNHFYARHDAPGPSDPTFDGFGLAPHDLHHVLATYGTTDDEECALQGLLLTASDGRHHMGGLTATVARQEWNALDGVFTQPRAKRLPRVDFPNLVRGLAAGEKIDPSFDEIEVFDVLELSVDEVRCAYGVPSRAESPAYEPALTPVTVPDKAAA